MGRQQTFLPESPSLVRLPAPFALPTPLSAPFLLIIPTRPATNSTKETRLTVALPDSIANTGSFFWTIPENIGDGQWSIAITDGTDADANYSPMFTITGGTGNQGSPGSASA